MGDAKKADRIVISGRTDAIGDVKVNEALAMARALAVRDCIRTVAPDIRATIAIDAKGRCCFVASNSDEDGRDRRIAASRSCSWPWEALDESADSQAFGHDSARDRSPIRGNATRQRAPLHTRSPSAG